MTGAFAIAIDEASIKRIEAATPEVLARDGDIDALSRAAGVAREVAEAAFDNPDIAARLLDAQSAAEDSGRLLKPAAARITLAMLRVLEQAVVSGELDVDDIGNLMPKVHRVVEHADRIEAGRGDGNGHLVTLNVTLVNGALQARVAPLEVVNEVQVAR